MARTDRSKGRPDYVPRSYGAGDHTKERLPIERRQMIEDLKERFDSINRRARERGDAWLTSIAGDPIVRLEVLPSSTFPAELEKLGYHLRHDGQGERILPHAIVERFSRNAFGELEPVTEGSTKPVVHRVTHAGIVAVDRFSFVL
jgi:hypothetical protein